MSEKIPGPSGLPILGNMLDVTSSDGYLKSCERLADTYGPIYQLTFNGKRHIVVSSGDFLLEMFDDKKWVTLPLDELSRGQEAKGMFSAKIEDPDWGQARRILMPSFGPLAVETMFEDMRDILNQMLLKWARMGDNHQVLVTDDFTRLTLDTISLCTMGYRFNSFYKDELHPFVDAMMTWLSSSGELSSRPWIINALLPGLVTKKLNAKRVLDDVVRQIIEEQRNNTRSRNNLVNTMMTKKDPETNEVMRDSLIAENMISFLIAGHETTSSLLSFAVAYMLQIPKVYRKARQEIDGVLGNARLEVHHLKKMNYLNGILRETLRLTPTIPSLEKGVHPDKKGEFMTIGNGKYHIGPDDTVEVLITKAQQDPKFFGSDAHEFKPERMMDDNPMFSELAKTWKPFGAGSRSCVGNQFAWQEALMALALILQNFDLDFVDPAYQIRVVEVMTLKPADVNVKVRLRNGITTSTLEKRLLGGNDDEEDASKPPSQEPSPGAEPKLAIYYGSNSGSCQSLAQKLASKAASDFNIKVIVGDLNSAIESSPRSPVVILSSTYEGQPPKNASRFVDWLDNSKGQPLDGIQYAVFGLGNKNWRATYHRIPRLIDTKLEDKGAKRLLPIKTVDVSTERIMDSLESWYDDELKTTLRNVLDVELSNSAEKEVEAEISTSQRAASISNGMALGKVLESMSLTAPNQPEKRHIEIRLPAGMSYECGDYLAILPLNGKELVRRIMARWELPWDATIVLKSASFAPLLTGVPLSIHDILTGYYELSQPPTRQALHKCLAYTTDKTGLAKINKRIEGLNDTGNQESLFDILERDPAINMPFPVFLSTLSPLQTRQYSISSSPMVDPSSCTLTYGVLRSAPTNDDTQPVFRGVASNYLASLNKNDAVQVSVKETATVNKTCPFRLPPDQESTPLLMVGAGSGLAPFRGFIQQRARMIELNGDMSKRLAPAILFMGCRSESEDRLYAEEMDRWVKSGAVEIRYAFSREPSRSEGCKYVTDRLWADRERVMDIWSQGARLYICGNRQLLEGIDKVTQKMIEESVTTAGGSFEDVEREKSRFWDECGQRAVSDIFD